MKIANYQIEKTRKHHMTRAEAYACFTDSEVLKSFFGRDNKIEIRLFGPYEIYFLDETHEERGSEGCQILSFIPNRMLSFTWNAPPSFPEIRHSQYHTWVVLEFEDQTIKLTHTGWPQGDDWKAVYEYFNQAWDVVLNGFSELHSD